MPRFVHSNADEIVESIVPTRELLWTHVWPHNTAKALKMICRVKSGAMQWTPVSSRSPSIVAGERPT